MKDAGKSPEPRPELVEPLARGLDKMREAELPSSQPPPPPFSAAGIGSDTLTPIRSRRRAHDKLGDPVDDLDNQGGEEEDLPQYEPEFEQTGEPSGGGGHGRVVEVETLPGGGAAAGGSGRPFWKRLRSSGK